MSHTLWCDVVLLVWIFMSEWAVSIISTFMVLRRVWNIKIEMLPH